MAWVALNDAGAVVGVFNNPQPDAVDEKGIVICKGVPTVYMADDDQQVVAFLAAHDAVLNAPPVNGITDLIKNAMTLDELKDALVQWRAS